MERQKLVVDLDGDRVETGSLQFNEDWPGVFIRGDNAFGYAMMLRSVMSLLGTEIPTIYRIQLEDLTELLLSAREWRYGAEE